MKRQFESVHAVVLLLFRSPAPRHAPPSGCGPPPSGCLAALPRARAGEAPREAGSGKSADALLLLICCGSAIV